MTAEISLGIDLGTSTVSVGVWRDTYVDIICRATPAMVSFTGTERLVGDAAKDQLSMNRANTVFEIKQLVGHTYNDKFVQEKCKRWSFKVVAGSDGGPLIRVDDMDKEKSLYPEEILGILLVKMKSIAEAHCRSVATNCVVTVPACYTEAQRQATRDVCTIAGLKVLRVIDESTAAAVAYKFQTITDRERSVVVIDIGAAHLSTSMVSIKSQCIEVKTTAGAPIGGTSFTECLVADLAAQIRQDHDKDVTKHPEALGRLYEVCETAKRTLSIAIQTRIKLHSLMDGLDVDVRITRAQFENMCLEPLGTMLDTIKNLLQVTKTVITQIDEIVVIGGTTHVPALRRMLEAYFGQRVCNSMTFSDSVATGAAIQAALLGEKQPAKLVTMTLHDVTPHTLGTSTKGGVMNVIVPRFTRVPVEMSETFVTTEDMQDCVGFGLFEGESDCTLSNRELGKVILDGIPLMPMGQVAMIATVNVDVDGTIALTVIEETTGSQSTTTIRAGRLSANDVDRLAAESKKRADDDTAAVAHEEAVSVFESRLMALKRKVVVAEKLLKEYNTTIKDEFEQKLKELESLFLL